MKNKLKTTVFAVAVFLLSLFFLQSCNIGSKSLVEQWKAEVAPDVGEKMASEVESRFNRMVSQPNEYQKAYLELASKIVSSMDYGQATHEDGEMLEGYVKKRVEEMLGGDYTDFSSEVVANYQSHPELYVENVCKLIEPVDELWDIARSYVTVKKSKRFKIAGYDNWLVLYQIRSSISGGRTRYCVCKIVDVGETDGYQESEIESDNIFNFSEALMAYSISEEILVELVND